MLTLKVQKREPKARLEAIREKGQIPAVYYGRKEKSTPIQLSKIDFIKVWKKAGESAVVALHAEDGEHEALIQDVDLDPVTGIPRHADFYVVEKGRKLKVKIPVEFFGVSGAVKDLAGILVKVRHQLEVEATPKDLPQNIQVDISSLVALDSQILASSIKLPEGVTLVSKPEEVLASIAVAKEEVEETVPVDLSAIEISEKKGKKDEEGAEGEAAAGAAAPEKKEAPAKK